MAKEIKGRNFILKIGAADSSILGSANKFSYTPNRDTIEVAATFGSGRSKYFVPDRTGYNVATEGLVLAGVDTSSQTGYFTLLNTMLNTDLSVNWSGTPYDASTGDKYLSGWGFLTSAPYQTGEGAVTTYSIEIQGSGNTLINNKT